MNPRASPSNATQSTDLQRLGAKVKQLREAAGLTQQQLATGIGSSRSSIARFEGGINDLGASRLIAIAKTLNLKPEDLFPA